MADVIELERTDVLAFRVARHGLAERRPASTPLAAVSPVGHRRTVHTASALAARIDSAEADAGARLSRAFAQAELVTIYGVRGTKTVVPFVDVDVFTTGAAPADDESRRSVLKPMIGGLDAAGISATDALRIVCDAVWDMLADGPLPRADVVMALTRTVPRPLAPACRGRCPDPHVEDLLVRMAGTSGVMRFDGDSDDDVLVRIDGWPGLDAAGTGERRAEVVRRYLRCYGPSTPATFAEWAGISRADARRSFDSLAGEVVPATVDGRKAGVLLSVDVGAATGTPSPAGTRLLPAYDAYLLDRDRSTLLPARDAQRAVWRAANPPGAVLTDGEIVATWRARKDGPAITPLPGTVGVAG